MPLHSPSFTPPEPIPAPLRGAEAGTFAHDRISHKLSEIARRTLAENNFSPGVAARLETLIAEIPGTPLRPLHDRRAPDALDWDAYLAPYAGQDWLEVPWFFAECYFFRRILEATGYFEPGPGQGYDPYTPQKRLGLEAALGELPGLGERLGASPDAPRESLERRLEALAGFASLAMWGNQADLSMWPAGGELAPVHTPPAQRQEHLLVDDSRPALEALLRQPAPPEVTMILDNAGTELVYDLALADRLLAYRAAGSIQIEVKAFPIYVSDATRADVTGLVDYLVQSAIPGIARLGERLQTALAEGRIHLRHQYFWNTPLMGWEMPPGLRALLAKPALLIFKGDANYRRLLGDRHWPFTTPFQEILRYRPAPVLCLRAIKSEVAAGLSPEQIQVLSAADPGWMTGGRWGVMQYAP